MYVLTVVGHAYADTQVSVSFCRLETLHLCFPGNIWQTLDEFYEWVALI
jgi:hypothetical protein